MSATGRHGQRAALQGRCTGLIERISQDERAGPRWRDRVPSGCLGLPSDLAAGDEGKNEQDSEDPTHHPDFLAQGCNLRLDLIGWPQLISES